VTGRLPPGGPAAGACRVALSCVLVAVILGATVAWSSPMPGSVPVRLQPLQKKARGKNGGRYELVAKVPVLSGIAASVAGRLNRQLAEGCPWTREMYRDVDSLDKGELYREDIEATVPLNGAGLLSVCYRGLGVNTLHGRMNSAHPTKLLRSLNFRLVDGSPLRLSQLFRKGVDWQRFLAIRVQREFTGDKNATPDPAAPRIGEGDFYLTRTELVIIFPDAAFVVQGLEVRVPYRDLADLADPKGPLMYFLPRR